MSELLNTKKVYSQSNIKCIVCGTLLLKYLSNWGTYWIYYCKKCNSIIYTDDKMEKLF